MREMFIQGSSTKAIKEVQQSSPHKPAIPMQTRVIVMLNVSNKTISVSPGRYLVHTATWESTNVVPPNPRYAINYRINMLVAQRHLNQ